MTTFATTVDSAELTAYADTLVTHLETVITAGARAIAAACANAAGELDGALLEENQSVSYDLASLSASVSAARHLVAHATTHQSDAAIALVFAADVAGDMQTRLLGREAAFGVGADFLGPVREQVQQGRDPQLIASCATKTIATGEVAERGLNDELEMVRQTFRRFAEERVKPIAEHVHRNDADIPDDIISGLAELGCFALSIPEEFGGFATGGSDELSNMVIVTEELSRGSLGAAGSLITRPEILGAALLHGGTAAQKERWLPQLAAGEKMCAISVTEPNVGSDVAGVSTTARRDGDSYIIDGVKTWCTFAGRAELLLVLVRTDPDRSKGHRGLSLVVVEKPKFAGHHWELTQPEGGRIEARAIPTLGYRGMHSFEVSFEGWRVPADALIGEEDGLGRGFYLQMQAFANGRLQTAARACGVMQAAVDEAVTYTTQRNVFGTPLAQYELSQNKIGLMAARLAASRVFSLAVAKQLSDNDPGAGLAASQVKQHTCRAAEWVTREALQLHGGYGYAEEYTVSRLFVDARVLSIFEGTDEVLALKIIARTLLSEAANAS
jgi:(2S)-methylsuccinyl-CoA dehydrogenase